MFVVMPVVVFMMMFLGRVSMKQLGKLMGGVALVAGIFLVLVLTLGSMDNKEEKEKEHAVAAATTGTQATDEEEEEEGIMSKMFHRFGTWRNRLLNHSSKPEDPKDYNVHDNFQVAHSNFAIASSGIIGKGPGNSVERDSLPHVPGRKFRRSAAVARLAEQRPSFMSVTYGASGNAQANTVEVAEYVQSFGVP